MKTMWCKCIMMLQSPADMIFVCGCDSSEVRYLLSLTCSEWDEHTIAHFHQLHRKEHIHFHSRIVEVGK